MTLFFLVCVGIHNNKSYDIETKRLVREYDSMKENIPVKNVDKAMNEVKEYLKELKEENEKETLEETLAKNALK